MEEEGEVSFANYLAGEKPYGFYVLYTRALFHEGLKMRYAYESTSGINCIMARHNKYTSYNVYTFPKFWRKFNKDY